MLVFNVLIIGAGKIGAFFDTPKSEAVLTHAHAFTSHPGFRLLGFVDADQRQSKLAAQIWGGEAFASISDAVAVNTIDVVIVAAPDEFHYELLKELAYYPLKLVFAEKPLTKKLSEAEEIVGLYHERGISLMVNYTRRFVPEFAALRGEIASGDFGRLLTGTGYYGKGTLHNGSHLVDLLCFLVNGIGSSKTISRIYDQYEDDPSCSALLLLEDGGQFVMQAIDCRCYTIFEMDLLFESGRMRIVDAGFSIEKYEIGENGVFTGYRSLHHANTVSTALVNAFFHAAESIYAHLSSGALLPCTGTESLQVQRVCMELLGIDS